MTIQACAEIVAKGDPDRFRATMAAPIQARAVLFPLYAFAVEVARAPWVTQEAMIAEMRLQWWRDVLTEISDGAPVRRHEVATPLAEALDPEGAQVLDDAVAARRWDIYRDPFEDEAALIRYLDETGASLTWTAARRLGAPLSAEPAVRQVARAAALARFLRAIPALEAAGRRPLVDGRPEAVAALAQQGLDWSGPSDALRRSLGRTPAAALLDGWTAVPILKQAAQHPILVAQGRLGLSPLRDRWRLLRWA